MEFPFAHKLTSERLLVRPLQSSDAPAMLDIYSGDGVTDFLLGPPLKDLRQAEEWVGDSLKRRASHEAMKFVIQIIDGPVIGNCGLFDFHWESERAEFGYTLGRPWWGQGYMTEALTVLLDFSFREAGLRRIEADIDPANQASARLLERLGFILEGRLRQRWCVASRLSDSAMYGLLAQDWYRSRPAND